MNYHQIGGFAITSVADNLATSFKNVDQLKVVSPNRSGLFLDGKTLIRRIRNNDELVRKLNQELSQLRKMRGVTSDMIIKKTQQINKAANDLMTDKNLWNKGVDNLPTSLKPMKADDFLRNLDVGKQAYKADLSKQLKDSGLYDRFIKDVVPKRLGLEGIQMTDNIAKSVEKETSQLFENLIARQFDDAVNEAVNNPIFIKGLNDINPKIRQISQDLVVNTAAGRTQIRARRVLDNVDEFFTPLRNRLRSADVITKETAEMTRDVRKIADNAPKGGDIWKGIDGVTDDMASESARRAARELGVESSQVGFKQAQEVAEILETIVRQSGAKNMDEALRSLDVLAREFPGDIRLARTQAHFGAVIGPSNRAFGTQLRKLSPREYIDGLAKQTAGGKTLIDNLGRIADFPIDAKKLKSMQKIMKGGRFGIRMPSKWKTKLFVVTAVPALALLITMAITNTIPWDDDLEEEEGRDLGDYLDHILGLEKKGEAPQGTAIEFLYTLYEAQVEEGEVDPALESIIQCFESGADLDFTPFAKGSRDFEGFAKDLDKFGCLAYENPNSAFLPEGADNSDMLDDWMLDYNKDDDDVKEEGPGFSDDMFSKKWLEKYWWVLLIAGIVLLMIIGLVIFLIMSGGKSKQTGRSRV